MKDRIKDDLVIAALEQAFVHRNPSSGLMHHFDKVSQYTNHNFQKKLS